MPNPSPSPARFSSVPPRSRAAWAASATLLLALAALPAASLSPPTAVPALALPSVAQGYADAGLADPFALAALLDAQGLSGLPAVLPAVVPEGRAVAAATQALQRQQEAEGLSLSLAGAPSLPDLLARAAAAAGIAAAPEPARPSYSSFLEAAPALGATAGLQVSPDDLEAFAALDGQLAPPLKRPILDLMASMVAAAQLRQEAFATLTLEEMRALAGAVDALHAGSEPDAQTVHPAAAKVDLGKLVAGAQLVSASSEDVVRAIQDHGDLWPAPSAPAGAAGPGAMAPYLPACGSVWPGPYSWPLVINTEVLELGNLASNTFDLDTILSIDPGPGGPPGDCYINNAGGTNPTFPGYPQLDPFNTGGPYFPVAVAIDVAGDDVYHSPPAVPTPATGPDALQRDSFIQGGAAFGIGLLLDVGGDDALNSNMVLEGCPFGFPLSPVGFDYFFVQGAAAFGVGVLADLEGEDRYNSDNALHQCDAETLPGDDVDYTVRYAQGAGYTGIGILLDAGTPDSDANDVYNSRNDLFADGMDLEPFGTGRAVYLVDHTQGAGAHVGVGLMVEANGDILYNSLNTVRATPNPFTLQNPAVPQSYAQYFAYCSQGIVGQCLPDCVETHEEGSPKAEPCLPPPCFNLDPLGVLCLPQVVAASRIGPTTTNVLGVLVDGLGHDKYNCGNFIRAADADGRTFFSPASSYRAEVVQGVAAGTAGLGALLNGLLNGQPIPIDALRVDLALGVHTDLEGDDCYNSANDVLGWEATLDVLRAQGVGQGTLAAGVLTDRARDDAYNSFNDVQAFKSTDIRIVFVQGNGAGFLTAGVHADATSPQGQSSDVYNSNNLQASYGPDNLEIDFSLGTAGGSLSLLGPAFGSPLDVPTTLGAMLDLDSMFQDPISPDSFNSGNIGGGTDGYLQIYVSEGAVAPPGVNVPPAYEGGAGVMVEVGAANLYNSNNAVYGTGGPDVPIGTQLYVILGVAPSLVDVGAFVDLSLEPYYATGMIPILGPFLNGVLAPMPNLLLGPDTYNAGALGYFPGAWLIGCSGLGVAVAVDAWDGTPAGAAIPPPFVAWPPGTPPATAPPWPPGLPLVPLLPYCVDL